MQKIKLIKIQFFGILLGLFFAMPYTVLASGNLTITVKNPDPYTGNQSWFVYEKKPGETIQDTATIRNNASTAVKAHIYAVDATSNSSGSFILKLENNEKTTTGQWTKISTTELNIPANSSIDVPFEISIPDNITPGQYFGGLVVEEISEPEKSQQSEEKNCCTNVVIRTRIGARIYLTVSGEINEKIDWNEFSYQKNLANTPSFKFKIANAGNVFYQVKAKIDVIDNFGKVYDTFENALGESLPNTVIEPTVNWNKKPFIGNFTAKATLTFFKKNQGLTDNLHGSSSMENFEKDVSFWVIPWNILVFGLLAIFGTIGSIKFRRYQENKFLLQCENYCVQDNENILKIAENHHIDWQKLAKINHLKAPYIIKKDDVIHVPKSTKKIE